MPVFLFMLGILLTGVGLFLIGFSIPFRDFSLGNTLIVSGAISIAAGLILIGIGATLRELRKITKSLDAGALGSRPAAAATAPAARSAPPPPPLTPPTPPRPAAVKLPPVVNTARNMRPEPRLDPPVEPEPPMPPAPTIADITAERPGGLFASIRKRSLATPQAVPREGFGAASARGPKADPAPPEPPSGIGGPLPDADDDDHPLPPPTRNVHPERRAFHPEQEPVHPEGVPPRSPSLSALAARTAARLDLSRPPEPPNADAEHESDETEPMFERPASEPAPEKPSRNMFDSVWPTEGRAASERAPAPPPEPKPPEILKSGVIDGMAYTLYTDGSIEAQLPQGTLRFTSIDDLRAHLERG